MSMLGSVPHCFNIGWAWPGPSRFGSGRPNGNAFSQSSRRTICRCRRCAGCRRSPGHVFHSVLCKFFTVFLYFGWIGGVTVRASDLRSSGRGFDSRSGRYRAIWDFSEYNLFHNSCSDNHCLRHIYTVNEKPCAIRLGLRTREHDFTLLFVINTILIRRILLPEPCTIIFRMCSPGLSYTFTMCLKCFNVLIFHNFFHCSACAFVTCLLNYLLTYLVRSTQPSIPPG